MTTQQWPDPDSTTPQQAPGPLAPTYYVRHPDGSYSVADPQPGVQQAPGPILSDARIAEIASSVPHSVFHAEWYTSFARAIAAEVAAPVGEVVGEGGTK